MSSRAFSIAILLGQLDFGGSEGQALTLAAELGTRGHRVAVFSFRGGKRQRGIDNETYTITVPQQGRLGAPKAILDCARFLRSQSPDVVYTLTFSANLWGRLLARLMRVPAIVAGYRQSRYYWFDRFTLGWNRAVICNCHAVRDLVIRRYSVAESRVHVVYNGVRPLANHPVEFGGEEDPPFPLILMMARLHPYKDHMTAFRAFSKVLEQAPLAKLLVLGDGPLHDTLVAHVAEVGLSDHVCFQPAVTDPTPILARADIGWLTSTVEGLPNAVLEYQASGLPVIATAAGGVEEIIASDSLGLVSRCGDWRSIARNTIRLVGDRRLRNRLGENGRDQVLRDFTVDSMVSHHERVMRAVVAEGLGEVKVAE